MSRFTEFRDNITIEIGNKLIGLMLDKLIGGLSGRFRSPEVPAPPELGDSDCPTGASSGATREADGRAGP